MKRARLEPRRIPYALTAGLALALALAPASTAQQGDPRDKEKERRRQERQLRFLEDREPAPTVREMAATPCVGGLAGNYPCNNIDLLAFLPLSSIGGGSGNDIWGWTDPMTGKEYAIMGRSTGASFVDISDPTNPVYLGNLPPHSFNSDWRDIKVYRDHAYIVSEAADHGMQVFDLTQLRNVVSPPATFTETAHYDDVGSAHNVAINEDTGYAYIVGSLFSCGGGPHFVNIQNPTAPFFAGCHSEPAYTHDTQCVVYHGPDAQHQGREICINSNEDTINIIDVTNKTAPAVLSQTTYANWGYIHQGWLTEDHAYYMQGDELDEQNFMHNSRTRIFDVRDLDAPVQIGTYDGPTAAIDHNLYTLGDYVYEANYRAGLRILDLDNIASGILTEVAYFDIYPSSDTSNFNGAWSVYPYFASGVVVVSGIEQGLFVLQPNLPADFDLEPSPGVLEICDPGSDLSTITVTDQNGYAGSVSFSVSGLPPAAGSDFSVDPLAVPGTSDLTVTTSGTAPGSYGLTVQATDGSLDESHGLTLDVADTAPGQPTTVMPANGAIDVSPTPLLGWTAAVQAFSYDIEVATDPGFASIVYTATTAATDHAVGVTLAPSTTHYWRVTPSNACGVGATSPAASFTTFSVPSILLVDDDDNTPNVRPTFIDALTALGEEFDVWNTDNSDDEPSAAALAPYDTVIWFTGAEFGGVAGPGPGGESALSSWLDDSGCLLISSQDYHADRGLTGLMRSYLGVASVTDDVAHTKATGDGAVFTGLGLYTFNFPYLFNFTDSIDPDASAERAWRNGGESLGVNKDTGVYRTTYWGFGLEGLPGETDREDVLSAFLGWCDALNGLDGDTDGVANGADCAPGDADAWDVPSPARDLTLSDAATDNLSWLAPIAPGGNLVLYDVLRSADPSSFGGAVCVESGDSDTLATESAEPAQGQTYYYLIRALNVCGGTLGNDPPRSGGTCP